ncbi:MAG: rod shape-determining protein MreD [Acidobacteria bacterium]|nr:MAG: rod shape-determining protein MreD [Acidobacteriota bacterium]
MKFLEIALAILVAFLVQTVLGRYFAFLNVYLDLFTVVAATFGLLRGRMVGLCTGTAAGLLQDAFSGGLLGFNGMSKTTVGYLAGIVGHHLIIRGWSTRLLFFVGATLLDMAILAGVGRLAEQPRVLGEGLTPLYLCVGNAIAGILLLGRVDRNRSSEIL